MCPAYTAKRHLSLAEHWQKRFKCRVRKVPLDAGLGCPNRDGTLSRQGCVFCNPAGSGTGLAAQGLSLAEQWERALGRAGRAPRRPAARPVARLVARPVAYLQSYTNTHCSPERLAGLLAELAGLPALAGAPAMAGVCIGTRPDCLEEAKLDLLAAFAQAMARRIPDFDFWLDLGLQSASDATLERINRGHDAACFAHAARRAGERGLQVCAHVMFGLPTGTGFGLPTGLGGGAVLGPAPALVQGPRAGKGIAGRPSSNGSPEKRARPEAPAALPASGAVAMETEGAEALWATMEFLGTLPVAGVKFHNTLVVRGAELARWWQAGEYRPAAMEDYAQAVAWAVARLRPGVVVHRLAADPAPGELLAPDWAAAKAAVLARIRDIMEEQDLRQGDLWPG